MRDPLITSDPRVMTGKPVVAGTRITVERILDKLAAGESFEQILESHPQLDRDAIFAALSASRLRGLPYSGPASGGVSK